MVLIAAGAEAPGTKIVEFETPFKQYSLSELKFCLVSYKNFERFSICLFKTN
jgi:hypothetical protein